MEVDEAFAELRDAVSNLAVILKHKPGTPRIHNKTIYTAKVEAAIECIDSVVNGDLDGFPNTQTAAAYLNFLHDAGEDLGQAEYEADYVSVKELVGLLQRTMYQ